MEIVQDVKDSPSRSLQFFRKQRDKLSTISELQVEWDRLDFSCLVRVIDREGNSVVLTGYRIGTNSEAALALLELARECDVHMDERVVVQSRGERGRLRIYASGASHEELLPTRTSYQSIQIIEEPISPIPDVPAVKTAETVSDVV